MEVDLLKEEFSHVSHAFFDTYDYSKVKAKPLRLKKSPNVCDSLNEIRDRMIDVLRKAQQDTLDRYKANANELKSLQTKDPDTIERVLKPRLFVNNTMFLLIDNRVRNDYISSKWSPSRLYLFVLDFYLSPFQLDLLKYNFKFTNSSNY